MGRLALILALLLAPVVAAAQVPYRAEIQGDLDRDLMRQVEDASRLIQARDEPPASPVALQRRAETDMDRIREVLRAEGYYQGEARFTIADGLVAVTVAKGPEFTLAAYDVLAEGTRPVPLDRLGVEIGARARSRMITDAQARLLHELAAQGHPLAKIADRRVVVDHDTRTMRVTITVVPGPPAHFGPVAVEGLENLDPDWVRRRVPWRQGDRFSVEPMEEMRKILAESRLFSSIRLRTATQLDENGQLPIIFDLHEADLRSVGAGANWSSSEGFGTQAFWEHRNLLGAAEKLRLSLTASEIRDALDAQFRAPDVLAADQDVISAFTLEEQRTEAYVIRTMGASGGLEWKLSREWRASASGALERSFEERGETVRNFTLFSLPLEARQDNTDDVLDPIRGNRFRIQVRPFFATDDFTRIEVQDSHYLQVLDDPRLILAGWVRAGTIRGAGLDDVPADKRFYVGGGGSVRAYGFQMAGPVDRGGDPTGGLSALSFGGELRLKITDDIGIVPFVEAGQAISGRTPLPEGGLLWGGGLGLRYFTPVGPVRADLAMPFNRRRGIDDSFQVLLSLGQAF